MKKLAGAFAALVLLVCVHGGGGSPLQKVPLREFQLGPYFHLSETRAFEANQRASLAIFGKTGKTYMALYIFDPHGNCVAWDDLGSSSTKDDLAVEWWPPQRQPYSFEIHNLGWQFTSCEIAIR